MLKRILRSFSKHYYSNAFFIGNQYYTYGEFEQKIKNILLALNNRGVPPKSRIGLNTYDDIETYASIFAIWFAGCTYVPINPKNPTERNSEIINEAEINLILSSKEEPSWMESENNPEMIITPALEDSRNDLEITKVKPDSISYILFTSGTTARPKGVPVSYKNLKSFLSSFSSLRMKISEEDNFLQMFDLSFDVSIASLLIPINAGCTIYTIPHDEVKYTYIYKLLSNYNITFATIVPSLLHYLQPYFGVIQLEKLRYCILTAEASTEDLVNQWSECIPNSRIFNLYGPTEACIWCFSYEWKRKPVSNKTYNGYISIGKPMKNVDALILGKSGKILKEGKKGELSIAGDHITQGYLGDPEKTNQSFIKVAKESNTKYYKTGDISFIGKDSNYMYCGRADNQVQIQGFRVELSEIEHNARHICNTSNVVAITIVNIKVITEIHLCIESWPGNTDEVKEYLKSKLAFYMQPAGIHIIDKFPLNKNGQTGATKYC